MTGADDVVFPFEDLGDSKELLPLAARRALDAAGLRLTLEGYQSLTRDDRHQLAVLGSRDTVDIATVERLVRKSSLPPTRIKPVADPDPRTPPEQLNAALGPRRAVEPMVWSKLRALDRYALIHIMRRSIAHDDPSRLAAAAKVLLPLRPRNEPPLAENVAESRRDARAKPRPNVESELPPALKQTRPEGKSHPDDGIPMALREPPPERRLPEERVTAPPPSEYPSRGGHVVGALSGAPLMDLDVEPSSYTPPSRPPAAHRKSAPPPVNELSTHLDEAGAARMIDVGHKDVTQRRATAFGQVRMRIETAQKLARQETPKGDVLAAARIAGILAAKRTPELIPLCHHIALTSVEVILDLEISTGLLHVTAVAHALDRTGVEMEALTAVSVACLTVYDMLKGIDKDLVIQEIRLLSKSGGTSGRR